MSTTQTQLYAPLQENRLRQREISRDYSVVAAGILSALVGAVALWWFYSQDLILAYSDAISHLNIARRVLDSRTPGIAQLGTVWLPVPHILMQPFIQNDFLWYSGLAGSIVGYCCFIVTALTLFLSIRLVVRHEIPAWLGLITFLSNPNALYIQTTALTEPVLLMSMTASTYFLLRWSGSLRYQSLIMAGIFATLAVGSRYDGWFFSILCAGLIILIAYLKTRNDRLAEGTSLAYLVLPAYTMFLWLFYNWLLFGDPLSFARSEFSAAYQQEQLFQAGSLPTKHNLWLSTLTYCWAVIDSLGLIVIVLAAGGVVVYALSTKLRPDALAVYAFLYAFPYNILALWLGQSIITTPHTVPPGYFNIRYGIAMLPAASLFIAYLAAWLLRYSRTSLVSSVCGLLLMLQFSFWIPGWPTSIAAVADGVIGSSAKTAPLETASYLRTHYTGGGILIDDTYSQFIFETRIQFREFIGTFSTDLWDSALQNPVEHVEWVVMRPGSSDDRVTRSINGVQLVRYFSPVFQENGLVIYRRMSSIR